MAAWEAQFMKLKAWQVAYRVALDVYRLVDRLPRSDLYSLGGQLQRSALSMPTNIAEGTARRGARDKARFYTIAKSSGEELKSLLLFARDLGRLSPAVFDHLMPRVDEACRLAHGMIEAMGAWSDP